MVYLVNISKLNRYPMGETPIPPPPPPVWGTYFDDSFWTPQIDYATWDGVKWLSGLYNNLYIDQIGTWVNGFRPQKIRITNIGTTFGSITLYGVLGSFIGTFFDFPGVNSAVVNLDFSSNENIQTLLVGTFSGGPFNVTNIEFYA